MRQTRLYFVQILFRLYLVRLAIVLQHFESTQQKNMWPTEHVAIASHCVMVPSTGFVGIHTIITGIHNRNRIRTLCARAVCAVGFLIFDFATTIFSS